MDLIGEASKQGRPIGEVGGRRNGEQSAAAVHRKQTAAGGNNEHGVNEDLMTQLSGPGSAELCVLHPGQ